MRACVCFEPKVLISLLTSSSLPLLSLSSLPISLPLSSLPMYISSLYLSPPLLSSYLLPISLSLSVYAFLYQMSRTPFQSSDVCAVGQQQVDSTRKRRRISTQQTNEPQEETADEGTQQLYSRILHHTKESSLLFPPLTQTHACSSLAASAIRSLLDPDQSSRATVAAFISGEWLRSSFV
jgi:hypothetical protein